MGRRGFRNKIKSLEKSLGEVREVGKNRDIVGLEVAGRDTNKGSRTVVSEIAYVTGIVIVEDSTLTYCGREDLGLTSPEGGLDPKNNMV